MSVRQRRTDFVRLTVFLRLGSPPLGSALRRAFYAGVKRCSWHARVQLIGRHQCKTNSEGTDMQAKKSDLGRRTLLKRASLEGSSPPPRSAR
jgi:hypothetical protein